MRIFLLAIVLVIAVGLGAYGGITLYGGGGNEPASVAEPIADTAAEAVETETMAPETVENTTEPEEKTTTANTRSTAENMAQLPPATPNTTIPAEQRTANDEGLLPGIALGDPNAPVVIEDFSSLTCPHCARFHNRVYPEIRKNYIDTGKVYYIYRDMPLNRGAFLATRLLRCLGNDGDYLRMTDMLYKEQIGWAESADVAGELKRRFGLIGMDEVAYEACVNDEEASQEILRTMQTLAGRYGINSTPTIVINRGERVIRGAGSYPAIEALIEQKLAAHNALQDAPAAEAETTETIEDKKEDGSEETSGSLPMSSPVAPGATGLEDSPTFQ